MVAAAAAALASAGAPAAGATLATGSSALSAGALAGGAAQGVGAGLGGVFASSAATPFAGIGIGNLISGGLTGLSALSMFRAGQSAEQELMQSAALSEIQASQDLLEGRRQSLEITDNLIETMERNRVAGFASGLQSSGSVAQASQDAMREANLSRDLTQSNAQIRAAGRRAQGAVTRSRASNAFQRGVTGAIGTVGNQAARNYRRTGNLFDFG